MIRRLVEAHYFQHRKNPNPAQVKFWLRELRTPELLTEVARANPAMCRRLVVVRPLLTHATTDAAALECALMAEETAERERDKIYWFPPAPGIGKTSPRQMKRIPIPNCNCAM